MLIPEAHANLEKVIEFLKEQKAESSLIESVEV